MLIFKLKSGKKMIQDHQIQMQLLKSNMSKRETFETMFPINTL